MGQSLSWRYWTLFLDFKRQSGCCFVRVLVSLCWQLEDVPLGVRWGGGAMVKNRRGIGLFIYQIAKLALSSRLFYMQICIQ